MKISLKTVVKNFQPSLKDLGPVRQFLNFLTCKRDKKNLIGIFNIVLFHTISNYNCVVCAGSQKFAIITKASVCHCFPYTVTFNRLLSIFTDDASTYISANVIVTLLTYKTKNNLTKNLYTIYFSLLSFRKTIKI